MTNINTSNIAYSINGSTRSRIIDITYHTGARKLSCKWSEMKYDYENDKECFVTMYNFLKAFIKGEFKYQFKNRGKNYLFAEMPAQQQNNIKALCASYEAFLSVAA